MKIGGLDHPPPLGNDRPGASGTLEKNFIVGEPQPSHRVKTLLNSISNIYYVIIFYDLTQLL